MVFIHDTEMALRAAVDLVNTLPLGSKHCALLARPLGSELQAWGERTLGRGKGLVAGEAGPGSERERPLSTAQANKKTTAHPRL